MVYFVPADAAFSSAVVATFGTPPHLSSLPVTTAQSMTPDSRARMSRAVTTPPSWALTPDFLILAEAAFL